MVALFALIGSVPYIALQLKAIVLGFNVLSSTGDAYQELSSAAWNDSAWYITLALAVFTVLFGTRHLESTEHHRGMIQDRKSTRLNSSHVRISYAVFCLKKKKE